jgi:hypothetical protein
MTMMMLTIDPEKRSCLPHRIRKGIFRREKMPTNWHGLLTHARWQLYLKYLFSKEILATNSL